MLCAVKYLDGQVFLKRSKGLGDGVVGYGLHLTPSELGPKIVSVTSGGEAARTGLISIGVSFALCSAILGLVCFN